jgi:hypothetical protein
MHGHSTELMCWPTPACPVSAMPFDLVLLGNEFGAFFASYGTWMCASALQPCATCNMSDIRVGNNTGEVTLISKPHADDIRV